MAVAQLRNVSPNTVVPKRNYQGIRGYVPVMTALKFTKFLIKGIMLCKK